MLNDNKIKELKERLKEIDQLFLNQDLIKDQKKYKEISKERSEIEEILNTFSKFQDVEKKITDTESLLQETQSDDELIELANQELESLQLERSKSEEALHKLLIIKDPNDDKDIFMEFRAGAGGDESSIFVADLFRMYQRYCEKKGWKIEIVDSHPSDLDGFKELIISVKGQKVYFDLKFESGVHRVQRIPQTESQGRIHTSTVTVAVLPEIEEEDIYIDPKDLRIDTYRSSGAGGQHVNKTDSAIRITHLPTGLVVTSQDERSQLQNKMRAMQVLRAKLYEIEEEKKRTKMSEERKSQIGTGDRSEKIRTYNFPQNRMTDHRINLTLYKLDKILYGDLEEIITKLQLFYTEQSKV